MKKEVADWIHQPKISQVLLSFATPKTSKKVERELNIKKLKMKPFKEKELVESLNPEARKGRLYVLTGRARRLLKFPSSKKEGDKDWDLIGWVMASPKQRLVVLRTMAIDSVKRTSEEVRKRASRLNPCLTRISTKGILKELVEKDLVETEMSEGRRYYWIGEEGRNVAADCNSYSI